jgi:hypothetical protein
MRGNVRGVVIVVVMVDVKLIGDRDGGQITFVGKCPAGGILESRSILGAGKARSEQKHVSLTLMLHFEGRRSRMMPTRVRQIPRINHVRCSLLAGETSLDATDEHVRPAERERAHVLAQVEVGERVVDKSGAVSSECTAYITSRGVASGVSG